MDFSYEFEYFDSLSNNYIRVEMYDYVVSEKSLKTYGGVSRTVLKFERALPTWDSWCGLEWIEGIGSTVGPFTIEPGDCWHYGVDLNCYREIGSTETIYGNCIPLSVEDIQEPQATIIYPNPINDVVYIQSEAIVDNLKIFALNGQLIHSIEPKSKETTVDVSFLKSGVYLIQLSGLEFADTKRIVKR